jgi:heterodisulfide reductase subunit C
LDATFKYEVAEKPGGENIKACFACGVCTGGCPVTAIDPAYDPRKIIRMIMLGMRDRVLDSDFIWLCALCSTCSFICPQDVKFSEVMEVLRDMALKEGHVDASFLKQMESIDRFAYAVRDKMIQAIVEKRHQPCELDPKKLLKEVLESL